MSFIVLSQSFSQICSIWIWEQVQFHLGYVTETIWNHNFYLPLVCHLTSDLKVFTVYTRRSNHAVFGLMIKRGGLKRVPNHKDCETIVKSSVFSVKNTLHRGRDFKPRVAYPVKKKKKKKKTAAANKKKEKKKR